MPILRDIDIIAFRAELLDLWNRNLASSFPLDEALFLQNLRPWEERLVCIGAFAEGAGEGGERLAGFAVVKRGLGLGSHPSAFGSLSLLLVDAPMRRRGIGSALVEAAENWLKEAGASGLMLGADRRHFFPGVPSQPGPPSGPLEALLARRGYKAGGFEHDLIGPALPAPDADDLGPAEGLAWIHAASPEAEGAEAFFMANFPGRWTAEYLEFIRGGFDGRDFLLVAEKASGKILGFCRLCLPSSPMRQPGLYWKGILGAAPGALGPIGIDKEERGRGLGLALLRRGLQELGARGAEQVVIDWTDQEAFYARLGFSVWKSYRAWSLDFHRSR